MGSIQFDAISIILIVVAAAAVIMAIVATIMLCTSSGKKDRNASQNRNMAFQPGPNAVQVGIPPQQPPHFEQFSAPVIEPVQEEKPFGARVDFSAEPQAPAASVGGFSSVAMEEAKAVPVTPVPKFDDTTVLMPPDDATELLSAIVEKVTLIRTRTGEGVEVNTGEFLIGRSANGVHYRIADNNSISRVHAKIILRDGLAYLVDMNAANGTSLNRKRVTPMQEYMLHDGDVITLANEEFVYRT